MRKIKNKAFTLIELLVVIAIIGILATLIIVSLSGARAKANDADKKSNANAISLALEQYYTDNRRTYPKPAPGEGSSGNVSYGYGIAANTEMGLAVTKYASAGVFNKQKRGTFTAKYNTAKCGTRDDGFYVQGWELDSNTETPLNNSVPQNREVPVNLILTKGNGVQKTDGRGGLLGYISASCSNSGSTKVTLTPVDSSVSFTASFNVFITFAPQ